MRESVVNAEIAHFRKRLAQFKKLGYDMLKERDFALAKAGFRKRKTILEVGTGRGYMALALARKGFAVTSIDQDRKILLAARSILKHFKVEKSIVLRRMDAERLKFKDLSFDYVLAVNFMHHAQMPVKCIREMARVAKEKIVIVDVNKRGARILEKLHAQEGHAHERSKIEFHEIRDAFIKAGMKVKTYRSGCQTIIIAQKG